MGGSVRTFAGNVDPPNFERLMLHRTPLSSIDSAFNSLSAATVQDVYVRYVNPHATERQYLFWSRATTATVTRSCC